MISLRDGTGNQFDQNSECNSRKQGINSAQQGIRRRGSRRIRFTSNENPAEGARTPLDAGDAEGVCSRDYYAMHDAAFTVTHPYLVNMEAPTAEQRAFASL